MVKRLVFHVLVCLFILSCNLSTIHELTLFMTGKLPSDESSKQSGQANRSINHTFLKIFTDSAEAFNSINFRDGRHGIVTGMDENFWLTSDGGCTWSKHKVRGEGIARKGGAYDLIKSGLTSSGDIYAIGHLEEVGSAIFTSNDSGRTWKINYYENASLNDIDVVGEDVWVVGAIDSVGVVLHSHERSRWEQIWKGGENQYPAAVDFVDQNLGWVVGADGLILHTMNGGRTWQIQHAPTEEALESVAFADAKNGYIVGQRGTILHTTDGGKTWYIQESGTDSNLTKVVTVSPKIAWVVGQNGVVLFTDDFGRHWQVQKIGTTADIFGVAIKSREVWIATSDGMILRTST